VALEERTLENREYGSDHAYGDVSADSVDHPEIPGHGQPAQ